MATQPQYLLLIWLWVGLESFGFYVWHGLLQGKGKTMEILLIGIVLWLYLDQRRQYKLLAQDYNNNLAKCCTVIKACGDAIDASSTIIQRLIDSRPPDGGSSIPGIEPGDILAGIVSRPSISFADGRCEIIPFKRNNPDAA